MAISKSAWACVALSLAAHSVVFAALALFPSWGSAPPLSVEVVIDFADFEPGPPASVPASAAPARRAAPMLRAAVAERPAPEPAEAGDALAETSAAPALPSGGDPSASELSARERYALELRQLLERRKTYPAPARRLGKQGRVLVRFTLSRDGSVVKAEILESSSHDILNEAARELVRAVSGFRPFPQEITRASWDFLVPIEYRL